VGESSSKGDRLGYNYFRDYDPQTGRYVESDPIGLQGGTFSTYSYVANNPLWYVDPDGTGPVGGVIGGTIGGILGGLVGAETGPGDAAVIAGGRAIGRAIGGAIEDSCRSNQCPPCKTITGRVVPLGTIAYRPLDIIPDDEAQHGVSGSTSQSISSEPDPVS
jgi:RHS repeat-associated protein